MKHHHKIIATCAAGLETLVADEMSYFGAEIISQTPGAVSCSCSLETAYRACLWSRFAARILMPLADFTAPDTDALYNGAASIDWSKHFSLDCTFAVDCTLSNSPIHHSRFAALRVKDAVADQFMNRCNKRPSVDTTAPDIRIHAFLTGPRGVISLDLSGESLHRRGYRTAGGDAPLKEFLAAAIVRFTGWSASVPQNGVLLDPLCGSATLLIEAALMYGDIAPGLDRKYFGFLKWQGHDSALWKRIVAEAAGRKDAGMHKPWPKIIGYDAGKETIRSASANIQKAGLTGKIHVERKEISLLNNPVRARENNAGRSGFIIVNPPYGERLGTMKTLRYMYRFLGSRLREEFPGWTAGIFTGHHELAHALAMKPEKKISLFNGPIPCDLLIFGLSAQEPGRDPARLSMAPGPVRCEADAFSNRIAKNMKRLAKWIKREGVTCYRVYDADIPEYNAAIDIYEQLIHVQEYAQPRTIDPAVAAKRIRQITEALEHIFSLPRKNIFLKVRKKQKGSSQYQKLQSRGSLHEVREYNCRLLVNLSDYIDTGLFLDHRTTRRMLQQHAQNTRFLNLFGYTGAATVHAAMGQAKTTTTVDLSRAYLDWAGYNLALNGFSEANHKMVRADCFEWLSKTHNQFDLIFADPPTFSNSKTTGRIFDIQKDHVELIRLAMKRLEPGGMMIFSSNAKRFKLHREDLVEFYLQDITRETISPDFHRTPRIHQCWIIRRKNDAHA